MVTPVLIVVFLFSLVLVYLAVTLLVTVFGWVAGRLTTADFRHQEAVRGRVDRLKELTFVITVGVVFFLVTPLVVWLAYVSGVLF